MSGKFYIVNMEPLARKGRRLLERAECIVVPVEKANEEDGVYALLKKTVDTRNKGIIKLSVHADSDQHEKKWRAREAAEVIRLVLDKNMDVILAAPNDPAIQSICGLIEDALKTTK